MIEGEFSNQLCEPEIVLYREMDSSGWVLWLIFYKYCVIYNDFLSLHNKSLK